MWIPLLTIALAIWVASVAVVIILQRRSAAATLAWLFALVFLPVIGLVIYRIIGPLRLERKRIKRNANKLVVKEALATLVAMEDVNSVEHIQLARVGMELGEASPLHAKEVELYLDGDSCYAGILAAINAATRHIHIEYYIWEPDQIGHELRDALIARKKAGVEVRIVLDGTGSNGLKKKFLAPLREAGIEVAWFNPVRLRSLRLRRPDFRTHRKIVVCDGRVGFTGGMNIADSQSASRCKDYYRDTHMRMTGSAVWPLQKMFVEDWYFAAGTLCPIDAETFPNQDKGGDYVVQILGSGPDSAAFAIHKALFTAINQSTDRLWITTPYFVPDDSMLMALTSAGLRDVDVRLIIPKRGDSKLVDLAARSYLPELLTSKVRVYEYDARFIHAKTMVCDDDVAIIGTANLDNRSFRLNFEDIAISYGEKVNEQLAKAFRDDLKHCHELTTQDIEKLPLKVRFGRATARLLSPLL
ncbi:MAG: cardiolipin synthase [Deltaproteobacteria bacterium]|nr:cardiolipin synthase [Deltaproteobacteria bacterium]